MRFRKKYNYNDDSIRKRRVVSLFFSSSTLSAISSSTTTRTTTTSNNPFFSSSRQFPFWIVIVFFWQALSSLSSTYPTTKTTILFIDAISIQPQRRHPQKQRLRPFQTRMKMTKTTNPTTTTTIDNESKSSISCTICSTSFDSRNQLFEHLKSNHGYIRTNNNNNKDTTSSLSSLLSSNANFMDPTVRTYAKIATRLQYYNPHHDAYYRFQCQCNNNENVQNDTNDSNNKSNTYNNNNNNNIMTLEDWNITQEYLRKPLPVAFRLNHYYYNHHHHQQQTQQQQQKILRKDNSDNQEDDSKSFFSGSRGGSAQLEYIHQLLKHESKTITVSKDDDDNRNDSTVGEAETNIPMNDSSSIPTNSSTTAMTNNTDSSTTTTTTTTATTTTTTDTNTSTTPSTFVTKTVTFMKPSPYFAPDTCRVAHIPPREWDSTTQRALSDAQDVGAVNRQELCSMVPVLLLLHGDNDNDYDNDNHDDETVSSNSNKNNNRLTLTQMQQQDQSISATTTTTETTATTTTTTSTSTSTTTTSTPRTILDLCAAPGSKTLQLIDELQNGCMSNLIVVNDSNRSRLLTVIRRSRLLSFFQKSCILFNSSDGRYFPTLRKWGGYKLKFDRILVDVPCSGDGTLRKLSMKDWNQWNVKHHLQLHKLQVRILCRALQLIKKGGGRIVYSTCSLDPIENEAVVLSAIAQMGGPSVYRIVRAPTYLQPNASKEFVYSPGATCWAVPHPNFHAETNPIMYQTFSDVPKQWTTNRKDIVPSMFPPSTRLESIWKQEYFLQNNNPKKKKWKKNKQHATTNPEDNDSNNNDDDIYIENDDNDEYNTKFQKELENAKFYGDIIKDDELMAYQSMLRNCCRILPQHLDSGGFFCAIIERTKPMYYPICFPKQKEACEYHGKIFYHHPVNEKNETTMSKQIRQFLSTFKIPGEEVYFEGLPTMEMAQEWLRKHNAYTLERSDVTMTLPNNITTTTTTTNTVHTNTDGDEDESDDEKDLNRNIEIIETKTRADNNNNKYNKNNHNRLPQYIPLYSKPHDDLVKEFCEFYGLHTDEEAARKAGVPRFPVENLVIVTNDNTNTNNNNNNNRGGNGNRGYSDDQDDTTTTTTIDQQARMVKTCLEADQAHIAVEMPKTKTDSSSLELSETATLTNTTTTSANTTTTTMTTTFGRRQEAEGEGEESVRNDIGETVLGPVSTKRRYFQLTIVSTEIQTLFSGGAKFRPIETGLSICWIPIPGMYRKKRSNHLHSNTTTNATTTSIDSSSKETKDDDFNTNDNYNDNYDNYDNEDTFDSLTTTTRANDNDIAISDIRQQQQQQQKQQQESIQLHRAEMNGRYGLLDEAAECIGMCATKRIVYLTLEQSIALLKDSQLPTNLMNTTTTTAGINSGARTNTISATATSASTDSPNNNRTDMENDNTRDVETIMLQNNNNSNNDDDDDDDANNNLVVRLPLSSSSSLSSLSPGGYIAICPLGRGQFKNNDHDNEKERVQAARDENDDENNNYNNKDENNKSLLYLSCTLTRDGTLQLLLDRRTADSWLRLLLLY